jgi:hypothetical protein
VATVVVARAEPAATAAAAAAPDPSAPLNTQRAAREAARSTFVDARAARFTPGDAAPRRCAGSTLAELARMKTSASLAILFLFVAGCGEDKAKAHYERCVALDKEKKYTEAIEACERAAEYTDTIGGDMAKVYLQPLRSKAGSAAETEKN